ncbi:MAG: hypothetical protein V3R64_06275 [Sphingomonadales bacterium]
MKKLIAIISGVSLAALVGGVSLADEKEEVKKSEDDIEATTDLNSSRSNTSSKKDPGEGDEETPKPTKNWNSAKSNTSKVAPDRDDDDIDTPSPTKNWNPAKSAKVAPDGDNGEGDDVPKGSGDPLKGLNICAHGGCNSVGETPDDDEGDEAQRMKGQFSRDSIRKEKKATDDDDSREEKKDDDGEG